LLIKAIGCPFAKIITHALQTVRAGDEAEIAFDAIPGRVFKGEVEGVMDAVAEGQVRPTGTLIDPESRQDPGRALARLKITEDLSEYQLPAGSSGRSPSTPSTGTTSPSSAGSCSG
jgi:hypothetical protein